MTVKLIITGRRPPGRTRAAMSHHMLQVHGRLVLLPPEDAGRMPCGYVQNHVLDGIYPDADAPPPIDRDFVTELWFEDGSALREAVSTPYFLSRLKPDESNFVAQPSVLRCLVDERDVIANGRPSTSKVFFFHQDGTQDRDSFRNSWQTAQHALSLSPGICRWTANSPLAAPSDRPDFAGIDEIWFAGDPVAAGALFDSLLARMGAAVTRPRSFFLLVEEFTTERLLQMFRDG